MSIRPQPAKRGSYRVSERRKEQNRQSQRAYREKKKRRLQTLERLAVSQKWAEITGAFASDTIPDEQSTFDLSRPFGPDAHRMNYGLLLDLQGPATARDQNIGSEKVPGDNSAAPPIGIHTTSRSKPSAPHLHDLPSSFSIMNSSGQTDPPLDTTSFGACAGIPYGRFNTFKLPQL
ncbi:uncharacterized protein BDZ99DRAFT_471155 [Mytilinidion resinicola]|uniref:BZIP domain-containing protein n=1 Tax=Mytilinidion resinicola TaxID=574789 RepID=A0A6A6Z6H3_9PEZI|nr:uncharacterized protein BDZ99DRAFT_471155 [Mytilinidion resinicola]KAF2815835.1 hypothetical protein BDZ99DRAFT_471155 [Mytilinidion resinicola]